MLMNSTRVDSRLESTLESTTSFVVDSLPLKKSFPPQNTVKIHQVPQFSFQETTNEKYCHRDEGFEKRKV
jgi:hypothetical protein